ncbi:MAG: phage tail sheath C-terminal domain-containing protein [Dehalococcoidia bacterium]
MVSPTYPGVYIREVPSGVRTITGVATSIAAFIGRAPRGPVNEPTRVQSFGEYDTAFGGLSLDSTVSYAVQHFFQNGGTDALIVRCYSPNGAADGIATVTLAPGVAAVAAQGTLTLGVNPADGETMTIGAKTYTFEAALTDVDGNVQIGATLPDTQQNIIDAINLTGTAGTQYAASMTAHPTVGAATSWSGNALVLTAQTAGTAGNALATTATFANAMNAFDNVTLGATTAGVDSQPGIVLGAANPGTWADNLRATVDYNVRDTSDTNSFNLTIAEIDPTAAATAPPVRSETFRNVSVDATSPLHVDLVLGNRSTLARVRTTQSSRPGATASQAFSGGDDGVALIDNDISLASLESSKAGLWALEKADLFNLLCIPPLTPTTDIGSTTRDAAATYCADRRAFFILDPPSTWASVTAAESGVDTLNLRNANVAVYFPRVKMADPLRDNQIGVFPPCGVVAGLYARTDGRRGVWKAPAGTEATMSGVRALQFPVTDGDSGRLNPLGVNCLRTFPVIGSVVWGARTLAGADALASEWKYVPIRRLALNIEESLYRGIQWAVFEPNDEPLWAQLRLNVGTFMQNLFRQGAFEGATPKDAYFVKCDGETTTASDRDRGIVNVWVGFAPLKPAEFVVIHLQQKTAEAS